jgi:hypothetical protein
VDSEQTIRTSDLDRDRAERVPRVLEYTTKWSAEFLKT